MRLPFFKSWKRRHFLFALTVLLSIFYWQCLPTKLFQDPYSMVLLDRNHQLLGAKIAPDGQWRFPPVDSVPYKFEIALTQFEDRRFYDHWGVDPKGIARAIRDNFQAGRIKSGGSTITMQVMRMARKRTGRSFWQKFIEVVLATRLEWRYSKKEILEMYASHAPFGGNVVGLNAAAWRYFGKAAHLLSWGEAATLAVLPNSPGLVHPGRNRDQLRQKRNRLLDIIRAQGYLDSLSCALAKDEPLPQDPLPLPRIAPHLLERVYTEVFEQAPEVYFKSSLDQQLQQRVQHIVDLHHQDLQTNDIHNMAVVVSYIPTGEVLAYVGNTKGKNHSNRVDICTAPRSTGSILKPLLYAFMLHEGDLLPQQLVSDIPIYDQSYRPQNYYENYDGVVPANKALIRSLNIPFVRMLADYGLQKFYFQLQKVGLSTLHKAAKHYGLSLILGGAEATLWDLVGVYSSMARSLNRYHQRRHTGKKAYYSEQDWRPLTYRLSPNPPKGKTTHIPKFLNAWSIYETFEVMRQLQRPSSEGAWEYFQSAKKIAWKTGTSFGFRDAWAIGLNAEYAIGVWVGNADGSGRPELVGVKAAAPVLFDLFDLVQAKKWFQAPQATPNNIQVCQKSGFRASRFCPQTDGLAVPDASLKAPICPYHKLVHLDSLGLHRVHADCEPTSRMRHESWFVLPPLEEHYYKASHPEYRPLPNFRSDCKDADQEQPMEFIYPKNRTRIFIPIDYDGEASRTVFKITHRKPKTKVYWHIDNSFLGVTQEFHHLELNPKPGKHRLILVDANGHKLEQDFEVVAKE